MTPSKPLARVLVAVSVAVCASTMLLRLADPDLFGHIATGRWMLAHGAIVRKDPFSYASDGPIRYTSAAAEVFFALIDRASGVIGLHVFHVLSIAALLVLVLRRSPGSAAARVLCLALVTVGSFSALTLKPQIFSYLLFAWLLVILDRAPSRSPGSLLFVPLIFVLWANLHRGGVFGVPVLGAAAAAFALRPSTRPHARALAAVTVLAALGLLVNSGGTYYYTSAFDVLGRPSFHARIAEWRPLTPGILWERHAAVVPLVLLAAAERALRTRRIDAELLILALTVVLAASGARLLPYVAIAAAPCAVRALDAIRERVFAYARPTVADALLVVVALALPPVHYESHVPKAFRGLGVCRSILPVALADFLQAHRPEGHLFHSFDFGGYFLYRLAPETPVLIDGRNDTAYSDAFFKRVTDAESQAPAFFELDDRYSFAEAAFRWGRFGDSRGRFLATSPDWVLVYWDDLSVAFAHRSRAPAATAALGYRYLRLDTVEANAARPLAPDDDAKFMDELRRNVREAPESARARFVLAAALRTRGALEEANREQAAADRIMAERGD